VPQDEDKPLEAGAPEADAPEPEPPAGVEDEPPIAGERLTPVTRGAILRRGPRGGDGGTPR
jgi:hypothetical protein